MTPVIGLEVHVQLATRSRLFSACPRAEDTTVAPNSRTDPVTLGLPGTLPALNREAVSLALRLGLAFGAADPVETAWQLLVGEGLHDPEDLRQLFPLPAAPLLCRADPELQPVPLCRRSRRAALEDFLWLGLCTAWMFDPARERLYRGAAYGIIAASAVSGLPIWRG